MTAQIDLISPLFLGEDRMTIVLDPTTKPAQAHRPVTLNFDYANADEDGGLVLPIVLTIQPPNVEGVGYIRRVFTRRRPTSFTFIAQEAGQHFILLKESGHNLWQGRLLIEVEGEKFSRVANSERV